MRTKSDNTLRDAAVEAVRANRTLRPELTWFFRGGPSHGGTTQSDVSGPVGRSDAARVGPCRMGRMDPLLRPPSFGRPRMGQRGDGDRGAIFKWKYQLGYPRRSWQSLGVDRLQPD